VGLEGFPFFQVVFHDPGRAGAIDVRQHAFLYSMALLVLVTILGSVLVYRTVTQEVRLSQLRTDFVSAVSHEFRSPLSSILALSERLDAARVRDPGQLAQYHKVIHHEAGRLSALVVRLLDFAQIEEGVKIYSPERVDLAAIARDAIQSCHYSVALERVQLSATEAPFWVRGDRTALQHSIQNLIENAVKYSPPDSPIAVTCAAANGCHVIEVQDRGIGVPLGEQARIFEKFYRGRQAIELNAHGVGIGLALVKHVVESHGGSVSVESQPDQGSRFRVRLPRAEA
jgi:signal transduction histidine kinase